MSDKPGIEIFHSWDLSKNLNGIETSALLVLSETVTLIASNKDVVDEAFFLLA